MLENFAIKSPGMSFNLWCSCVHPNALWKLAKWKFSVQSIFYVSSNKIYEQIKLNKDLHLCRSVSTFLSSSWVSTVYFWPPVQTILLPEKLSSFRTIWPKTRHSFNISRTSSRRSTLRYVSLLITDNIYWAFHRTFILDFCFGLLFWTFIFLFQFGWTFL